MAYFLNTTSGKGEIAAFISPWLWKEIMKNTFVKPEDIIEIEIQFLGTVGKYFVELSYLQKYNLPDDKVVVIGEDDSEESAKVFFNLNPIEPSVLKAYLAKIDKV